MRDIWQAIIDIVWLVAVLLGVIIGRYTGIVTPGEFYIALILLVATSKLMLFTYSK